MKKTLAVIALSTLLATPVLADTQPADMQPPNTESGGLVMKMKGIDLNIGGFIEAASIYRTRNENSDISSKFQSIPTPGSAAAHQDETRFSARQTRLSILASGDATPAIHLAGYYEMDFLGAAGTANSNESNSYNPRIRHLYTTADWDSLGLHLLAGQSWSLVTLNNKGITPRNEVTPLTIDAQYVPGFTWARQAQFRLTKDFGKMLWLAVSVENPQTVASTPGLPSGYSITSNAALNQSGGGSLTGVTLSQNDVPDVVFKAAVEPGWGHFEVLDLVRTFKSTFGNADYERTVNAVGAGVILPLVPDHLTFQVSGIYGQGIGRYGSGQLADVTQDATGNIHPITETQLLFGLTFNPTSDLTFYSYYGLEQAVRADMGSGSVTYDSAASQTNIPASVTKTAYYGYGNTANSTGAIQRIDQFTLGTWWKFLQGKFGRMQAGLQYSFTEDKYFSSTSYHAPLAIDQMVFASLRYYWQ